MGNQRKPALQSAAVLSIVAIAVAGFVVFGLGRAGGQAWTLVIAAALATFGVGYVLWRRMVHSASEAVLRKGILAGAATGLLAHPVAWYLAILTNYFLRRSMFPGAAPVGPLDGIWASLVYSFFSLIFTGWLTVPAGAATGWLLARRSTR